MVDDRGQKQSITSKDWEEDEWNDSSNFLPFFPACVTGRPRWCLSCRVIDNTNYVMIDNVGMTQSQYQEEPVRFPSLSSEPGTSPPFLRQTWAEWNITHTQSFATSFLRHCQSILCVCVEAFKAAQDLRCLFSIGNDVKITWMGTTQWESEQPLSFATTLKFGIPIWPFPF